MKKYDFCIIGAGIVGLATAYSLSKRHPKAQIVILEKEATPGFHQTGHNSGVIHAGIYYAPGSSKAILCRKGLDETKHFCNKYQIPFDECGKLIVATNDIELERIEALYKRAAANELKLERISGDRLNKIEPNITGLEAILSSETAIVDYKLIALRLTQLLAAKGVELKFNQNVTEIVEEPSKVFVAAEDNKLYCEQLIVCGGLQSDRLANIAGLDVDFKIVPFRGEYFRLRSERNQIVKHLIYPTPDPNMPFLGVHLTRMMGGYVTVGPNAVLGFAREDYEKWGVNWLDTYDFSTYAGFWRLLKKNSKHAIYELYGSLNSGAYLKRCQKYCPSLTLADFLPYRAGIRAQAVSTDGVLIHDFLFKETTRMIHVCNAPSPAATSAFPIGEMIADKCHFN